MIYNKSIISFFIFSILSISLIAQKKVIDKDLFSIDILELYSKGEIRKSQAAHFFAKIGCHRNALSLAGESLIELGFDTLTEESLFYYKTFKPYNAKLSITNAAESRQIVMINEAHENPQHRVFTKHLLRGLFDYGYRYLLLEGLSTQLGVPNEFKDTLLHQRKYLLDSPISGIYTTEPQYSNLAREALELGYKVLAYDGMGQNRENEAVQNIAKVLKNDPSSKIIIHCGYSHIYEQIDTSFGGINWLGKKIKDSLNIDPLTINQVILTEKPSSKESPFYGIMEFDEPTIFKNSKNELYNGFRNMTHFDILLYQPRTKYIYNRPHWLVNQENHQLIEIKSEIPVFPCLIKAFKDHDSPEAVPIDVIEKKSKDDPSFLVLPTGIYRIEIIGENGIIDSYQIKVF